jgi:hypothetical protein
VDAQTAWTLAFGDNSTNGSGTALPATVIHSYRAAGNFLPKATVTFGDGQKAEQTLTIAVLSAATGPSDLYNRTFTATIKTSNPTSPGCGLPTDAATCEGDQAKAAHDHGANGTFFVWYDVKVPAGAASLFVEGGSHAAQTCTPAACDPDFDMFAFDPSGTQTQFVSGADWETGVVSSPAAGTWGVVVAYYAGAPNADATTHIVVK